MANVVIPYTFKQVPPLDKEMIEHLERLSLVMFNNKAGVERLQSAIGFANQLYMVDTEGVEPLDNVLEDRYITLFIGSSVVECLTQDHRTAALSLTSITALWSLSKTHLS